MKGFAVILFLALGACTSHQTINLTVERFYFNVERNVVVVEE